MSRHIAIGLDQQGRQIPTMVLRQLELEDRALVCDTCPGELDSPEASFQCDPDPQAWAFRDVVLIVLSLALGIPFVAHVVATIADGIPH